MLEWGLNTPPIGSKTALITHLRSVERQTGKPPLQLQQYYDQQAPAYLKYILELFYDFYNGQRFSYVELQSWQDAMHINLDPTESELIRQLCLEREAFDLKRQLAAQQAAIPKTGKR